VPAKVLLVDRPILFGQFGDYRSYEPFGFSDESGSDQTWNDGYVAGLHFLLSPLRHDPVLQVIAHPFTVEGRLPFQDITIYLNGRWIGFTRAEETVNLDCPFRNDYLSSRDNVLSFVMPLATPPKSLQDSPDLRRLAFAFRSLTVRDQA
jgi:hypothetical protein